MSTTLLKYVTLDVFTKQRFRGNPLAIVSVPEDVVLSQHQRQTVAREFNYSETVFIKHIPENDGDLRSAYIWEVNIHTASEELPFAGHPTIGTACYILSAFPESATCGSLLKVPAGSINIDYDAKDLSAQAAIPQNVHIHEATFSDEQIMKLYPSLKGHANSVPRRSAVVSIVKGMTFVLVKLCNEEALNAVTTTVQAPEPKLDPEWDESFVGTYFYWHPNSDDIRLRTRMIEGTLEDPATGSAACTLAAYLAISVAKTHSPREYLITQGVEMGRRSNISVTVTLSSSGKQVERLVLGGHAVQVMEGSLQLAK